MAKKLLICPVCEKKGIKSILGELKEDGSFVVQRFHEGETKIIGNRFSVICGGCGSTIYFKKERRNVSEDFHYWFNRLCWYKSHQGTPEATD